MSTSQMQCGNCLRSYNTNELPPRILISCGHTFCEECLSQRLYQSKIQCFECDTVCGVDSVEQLPKNLALLPTEKSVVLSENQTEEFCSQHRKKLEAFCHTCLALLCIDCIIQKSQSEHGHHDISSLHDAALSCKQSIEDQKEEIQNQSIVLSQACESLNQSEQDLHTKYQENLTRVNDLFEYVRMTINDREKVVKAYLTEVFQTESNKCKEKISALTTAHDNLLKVVDFEIDSLSDIRTLRQSVVMREMQNCLMNSSTVLKSSSFSLSGDSSTVTDSSSFAQQDLDGLADVVVSSEVNFISKILSTGYKGSTSTCSHLFSPQLETAKQATQNKFRKSDQNISQNLQRDLSRGRSSANLQKGPIKKQTSQQIHSSPHQQRKSTMPSVNQKLQTQKTSEQQLKGQQSDYTKNRNINSSTNIINKETPSQTPPLVKEKSKALQTQKPQVQQRQMVSKEIAQVQNQINQVLQGFEQRNSPIKRSSSRKQQSNQEVGQNYQNPFESDEDDQLPVNIPAANLKQTRELIDDSKSVACELSSKSLMETTTPLKSYLNQDNNYYFKLSTIDANMSQISHQTYDPLRAFGVLKSEQIYVFSGFNDHKIQDCEVFNTVNQTWTQIAKIQTPRTKFSAVAISKHRILIFGGKQSDGQRSNQIEEYNVKQNTFKLLPFKMQKPKSGFSASGLQSRIFFCGGNGGGSQPGGSILRRFDCLDLKKGKWNRMPDMLVNRDELQTTMGPDGCLYAVGGYGGQFTHNDDLDSPSECLKSAERFDFELEQWETLPSMSDARRALAIVAMPDGIYAIGGYDGQKYLATVEKYCLMTNKWVKVRPMNTARCTLSAVVSADCLHIYVIGGYNGQPLDVVERFSVLTETWEYMPPMITKRFMHQCVNIMN